MLLFHGTTVENAKNILKNGFNYNDSIWTCSGCETYFFHENYLKEEHGIDSPEEILERGIREALDQSVITLAIQNPSDYRGAVLVFESDLMSNGGELEPDYSCEGMSSMAVALRNPDMNGLVGVYIMDQDLRSIRLITLAQLQGRTWISEVELSAFEQKLVDQLVETSVDTTELLNEITYTKLKTKQPKKQGLLKAA